MSDKNIVTKECSLTSPADRDRVNKWRPDSYPSLTTDQLTSAMKDLNDSSVLVNYPKVDRVYADPPIHLQKFGLVSFVPSKGATPDKDGFYGFVKLRGNYDNEIEANQRAEYLIKDIDSYNKIYHVYVGRPFPLTTSSAFSSDVKQVDVRGKIAESVTENIKKVKQEDEKVIAELKQKETELLEESEKARKGEKVVDADPYDEYVTLNVKKAQCSWTYLEHMKKMAEVRKIILQSRQRIAELDKEHPEFKDNYFNKYKAAREKAGLTDKVINDQDNFIKMMVEDKFLPGIDDLTKEDIEKHILPNPLPPVDFKVESSQSSEPVTITTTSTTNSSLPITSNISQVNSSSKNKKKSKKK